MRALAGSADPVEAIIARARSIVLEAMDKGWTGPPFDPVTLAEILGVEISANAEVRDARTLPLHGGKLRIEFNPNRPRGRMRYSIAHEIAHTLFPDVRERVRNRASHHELLGDDWQLEALCNVAAAEFLMPVGPLTLGMEEQHVDSRRLVELQRRFDVSLETLAIRLAETTAEPAAAFCASPRARGGRAEYALDYLVPSRSWGGKVQRSIRLPRSSVVHQCTAIGYSASGTEEWLAGAGEMVVEAIGIPPYPGGSAPRVVGLLRLASDDDAERRPCPKYVFGSALDPRGVGERIVAQIVNDRTPNWGGGGFASAVRRSWPRVQEDFIDWASANRDAFRLGAVRMSRVDDSISLASIVAQRGYGAASKPRIRYGALQTGLDKLARIAASRGATVHMPRIGSGQAGGRWEIVAELIVETLCRADVEVIVYDLPGTTPPPAAQTTLSLVGKAE